MLYVRKEEAHLQVGKGWHALVKELIQKLDEVNPDYTIMQVKEKFGGLRFYTSGPVDYDLIQKYEAVSYKTCEVCGSKRSVTNAPLEGSYWTRTMCGACRRRKAKIVY